MLTLEFRHGSRTPVRFAKSPLWETVAFARLVAKGDGERTRDTIEAREIPLLDALLARELPYTPDFLAPPPLQTEETFEEEVRRLRAISPDVVASELSRMLCGLRRSAESPALVRYRSCPGRLLAALAEELTLVWRRALHDQWRRLQAILDGDIMIRARRLALDGPGGMFPDLPGLQFGDHHLTVTAGRAGRRVTLDRDLLLVPTVFGWPALSAVLDPPWRLSVYYPARGAGELWQAATDSRDSPRNTRRAHAGARTQGGGPAVNDDAGGRAPANRAGLGFTAPPSTAHGRLGASHARRQRRHLRAHRRRGRAALPARARFLSDLGCDWEQLPGPIGHAPIDASRRGDLARRGPRPHDDQVVVLVQPDDALRVDARLAPLDPGRAAERITSLSPSHDVRDVTSASASPGPAGDRLRLSPSKL